MTKTHTYEDDIFDGTTPVTITLTNDEWVDVLDELEREDLNGTAFNERLPGIITKIKDHVTCPDN